MNKFFQIIKRNKFRFGILSIVFALTFFVISLFGFWFINQKNLPDQISEDIPSVGLIDTIVRQVFINSTLPISFPTGSTFSSDNNLPKFITQGEGNLVVSPQKGDNGEYFIKFDSPTISTVYSIKVLNAPTDLNELKQKLMDYLGTDINKYGIYIKDIDRNTSMNINGDIVLPPASMAKMTMAMLVMRDVDAGEYTLDDTYPIQDSVKFSTEDDLGVLPDGTEVPLSTYLEKLLEDSNNTAWYHLDKFLGGSYESVNPRTVNELGVNPLFLNPHEGTANMLGKLFDDLYNARTVSAKSRDYLINLLENAQSWNREGIGLGLPADVQFANKIGNLWTENDINFCDSAIVYGKNTDYIIIIMDKDIDWDTGKENLKNLSQIVYSYLDK